MRILQLLTRRGLLLGNLVLGAIFALVALAAVRPLLNAKPQVRLAVNVRQVAADARQAPKAAQVVEAGLAVPRLDEYARMIEANNVFSSKVPKPKPPEDQEKPPPRDPRWILLGMWRPEAETWEATIKDMSKPRGRQELVAREGVRFRLERYEVLITEVTAQRVRFEIHTKEHDHPFERVLTRNGVKAGGSGQNDGR